MRKEVDTKTYVTLAGDFGWRPRGTVLALVPKHASQAVFDVGGGQEHVGVYA